MNLGEAARMLNFRREQVLAAIHLGVAEPHSKRIVKLAAVENGHDWDINEEDLDAFIGVFEREEPGRHPPASVRRELLVEAAHKCGICRESAPLQFHHMIEWSKTRSHDPLHMLALCGTCHDKCGNGQIDYKAQQVYKRILSDRFDSTRQRIVDPESESLNPALNVEVDITIDRSFADFSDEEQERLLLALSRLLNVSRRITVLRKTRGSVHLRLELTRDEADRLSEIWERGGACAAWHCRRITNPDVS